MDRPIFDRLIHVPGPNPIVRTGDPGEWDDGVIEACIAFKDEQAYYLYYHATAEDAERWGPHGYRLGVATARHPLGPWTKQNTEPVIDRGEEGSWESLHVACASVLKEGEDSYTLWYSGCRDHPRWDVGLATSNSPLGPWTKCDANPVAVDAGYLGGVVKADGKYRMYVEHPIDGTSPDQGPFRLLEADRPEGPWEWRDEVVLDAGETGAWDDGGYSEAGVLYHEGVYHMFYGGTKWRKLESIGYATSDDGVRFRKHPQNPVVMRERCPDVSAMAEVHALYEPPLFYCYATERYWSREGAEDIGVQILATSTPFRIVMPIGAADCLGPGGATALGDWPPIGTENANTLSVTVEATYAEDATAGVQLHAYPSTDGLTYDTEPATTLAIPFAPGKTCRKTLPMSTESQFIGVTVENLDGRCAATGISVKASVGST